MEKVDLVGAARGEVLQFAFDHPEMKYFMVEARSKIKFEKNTQLLS